MPRFYLTTPIYYVNDLPHIGHIYTTVVADTLARYRRLAGDDVRFLTGTDEHGQKIERAAKKDGVTPIALADRVVARYHELWRRLDVSHDDFIRTTEPRHERAVAEILARMTEAGDIYVAKHEGWYCTGCETFYTEKELRQPGNLCPDHGTPTEWKSEENLFFRLSKYERPLLDLYERNPEFVRPETRRNEIVSFVSSGLKDLSISRFGLDWGVPFPGRPGHSVWVWLDALTNYISALGYGGPASGQALFDRYWRDGDVRLHLVGKDIVRFHSVFWPAFLMSAGVPLPTGVYAHGWWQRDGQKMSKSVGNVVRPDHLIERFGGDALRYFLLREMVFGQDASFSDEAFVDRFNADLANDLGNTASRLVTLSRQAFGGTTPPTACDDNELIPVAREVVAEYRGAMEELAFQSALRSLWRLLAEANQYLVAREPWKKIKSEGPSEGLSRVLWNGLESVRLVATALLPVMPKTAARVLAGIGAGEAPSTLDALAWGGMPTGRELPPLEPLFPRIDKEKYMAEIVPAAAAPAPVPASENATSSNVIDIQQFLATELKVGKVVSCEAVPKSEKLLKLRVDLGEPAGPRQVLAGIAKAYRPEELVDTEVILVANLKPAKLMGMESQGMVLAATDAEGQPILLRPHKAGAAPGTRVK
jgi:methionyl-tRNA synthetase